MNSLPDSTAIPTGPALVRAALGQSRAVALPAGVSPLAAGLLAGIAQASAAKARRKPGRSASVIDYIPDTLDYGNLADSTGGIAVRVSSAKGDAGTPSKDQRARCYALAGRFRTARVIAFCAEDGVSGTDPDITLRHRLLDLIAQVLADPNPFKWIMVYAEDRLFRSGPLLDLVRPLLIPQNVRVVVVKTDNSGGVKVYSPLDETGWAELRKLCVKGGREAKATASRTGRGRAVTALPALCAYGYDVDERRRRDDDDKDPQVQELDRRLAAYREHGRYDPTEHAGIETGGRGDSRMIRTFVFDENPIIDPATGGAVVLPNGRTATAAEVVRWIFDTYESWIVAGYGPAGGPAAIAATLRGLRIPTPARHKGKDGSDDDEDWSAGHVLAILVRFSYTARFVQWLPPLDENGSAVPDLVAEVQGLDDRSETVEVPARLWPRLITLVQFDTIRDALRKREEGRNPNGRGARPGPGKGAGLLTGYASCALHPGRRLSLESSGKAKVPGQRRAHFYVCGRYTPGIGRCPTRAPMVELDATAVDRFISDLSRARVRAAVLAAPDKHRTRELKSKIAIASADYTDHDEDVDRYRKIRTEQGGVLDEDQGVAFERAKAARDEAEGRRTGYRKELAELDAEPTLTPLLSGLAADADDGTPADETVIRERWEALDPRRQAAGMADWFSSIETYPSPAPRLIDIGSWTDEDGREHPHAAGVMSGVAVPAQFRTVFTHRTLTGCGCGDCGPACVQRLVDDIETRYVTAATAAYRAGQERHADRPRSALTVQRPGAAPLVPLAVTGRNRQEVAANAVTLLLAELGTRWLTVDTAAAALAARGLTVTRGEISTVLGRLVRAGAVGSVMAPGGTLLVVRTGGDPGAALTAWKASRPLPGQRWRDLITEVITTEGQVTTARLAEVADERGITSRGWIKTLKVMTTEGLLVFGWGERREGTHGAPQGVWRAA